MNLEKKLSIETLETLINNGNDNLLRSYYIDVLGELHNENNRIFEIIEYCIISDESTVVKMSALEVIAKYFLNKSPSLLEWVIQYESSMQILSFAINVIKENFLAKYDLFMDTLLGRVAKIYGLCINESKFILDLLFLLNKNKPDYLLKVNLFSFKESQCSYISMVKNLENKLTHAVENGHVVALNLFSFKLGELPDSIGLLSHLEYLNLAGNNLTFLPDSFNSLYNIKELNLAGNNLNFSDLDYIYEIAKKNYTKHYVKEGVVSSEASVLGLLDILMGLSLEKVLRDFDLSSMEWFNFFRIDELGHIIGIYIDFPGYYEIGIFPKQICSLKFLEELRLSNCSIPIIPEEIGMLTSLRMLSLHGNKITKIPKAIDKIKNLKVLNLQNNSELNVKQDTIKNLKHLPH